jgi:hypothetical protein
LSNYTQSTNFATKDSLPSGDPLKIVKGTEINTEFVNISVAIATKADLASPTFTGTPAAPTASSGTNTTQLATTAFVTAAVAATMAALYPVGSIYINAGVSTNPATLLGFGTWTAFGAGRVMVGLNGSDALFDTLEETGGSKDAITVSHTHTATSTVTDPTHQHGASSGNFLTETGTGTYAYGGGGANISVVTNTASVSTGVTVATTVASAGSSGTNANLPPYIAVAMWKRTA